ncbi:Transposase [Candidatus Electrothrix laxa]
MRVDSLIAEKSRTAPALQAPEEFYPRMLGHLIRHVAEQKREELAEMKELIVITDTIPINKKRAAVEKGVKAVLKKMLPSGCRFRVLHHASMSNMGLQLADYSNWAIFRKWESEDRLFYDELNEGIKSELEI